jgi:Spore coat protein
MDQNFESMSVNGMPRTSDMPEANSIPRDPDARRGGSEGSAAGSQRTDERIDRREDIPTRPMAMNDHAVAADLLISAKNGVKTYAEAITEAATPTVRTLLKRQLDEAIAFQDQVSAYMTKRGWYNAYNVNQQILIDLNQTQDTMDQLGR